MFAQVKSKAKHVSLDFTSVEKSVFIISIVFVFSSSSTIAHTTDSLHALVLYLTSLLVTFHYKPKIQ